MQYFVEGSSAKLRKGDINPTGLTAFGYDAGYTFMLVEIAGDDLYFQTVTLAGQTIDSGVVRKGVDNRVIGTAGKGGPAGPNTKSQTPNPK